MKKTLRMAIFALSLFLLVGCSSMDRDASKMAKRAVEYEQTMKSRGDRSNLNGKRMSDQEFEQYTREYIDYTNKMLKKYSDTPEKRKEFQQLVNKKIEELKK